jgi:ADP-glucose pyrophosphorylase
MESLHSNSCVNATVKNIIFADNINQNGFQNHIFAGWKLYANER